MLHTLTFGRNIDTDLVKDCAQLYKEMYQQEAVGLFTTATPMEFI